MTGRIVFRESWLKRKKKRVVKVSHTPRKKRRRARPRYPSNKKLIANIIEVFCELARAVAEVQASSKSRQKK